MKIMQKGFTIVELLIVVVVIGILAAIVTVAYTGISSSAHKSAVFSDLAGFAKKMELYKVQNSTYPTDGTMLTNADLRVTQGSYDVRNNLYYSVDTGGRWYALAGITQGVAHCLESGTIVENGGSGCNSYENTRLNVVAQAAADGVTITTGNTWSSVGYDYPGDGAGAGWATWWSN